MRSRMQEDPKLYGCCMNAFAVVSFYGKVYYRLCNGGHFLPRFAADVPVVVVMNPHVATLQAVEPLRLDAAAECEAEYSPVPAQRIGFILPTCARAVESLILYMI